MPCDCPNCKRDNILNGTLIAECSCCSKKLDAKTKFQILPDKSLSCDECVSKHYVMCPTCQKLHKKDSMKTADKSNNDGTKVKITVCEKCFINNFRECNECHGFFDRHDAMGHDNKTFCKSCFSKHYQSCTRCNTTYPKGQVTRTIRDKYLVCDKCYSFYGPIDLYEKKPVMNFIGTPPHFYGTELEVELVNAKREERGLKAEEVLGLFDQDFVILKEDGSIRCGFEIVTQPASIEEQKKRWNKFFDNLPKNLHSFNTSNCGLHIHCSKKPLSMLTIAKIVVFVNDDKNQSFVETIAGRHSCNFSQIQKKDYGTVKRIGQIGRENRYEAVNLVNKDTIEFRIFKGTLKRESFFKAIEFCDSLIKFCMTATNGIVYCRDKQNFIKFVESRQKDYPHLYAFICAKFLKKETTFTKKFGFKVEGLSEPPNPTPNQSGPAPAAEAPSTDNQV